MEDTEYQGYRNQEDRMKKARGTECQHSTREGGVISRNHTVRVIEGHEMLNVGTGDPLTGRGKCPDIF